MFYISTIIPTYKRNKDLIECLDSIITQTLLPNEVIVIDNEKSVATDELINQQKNNFEKHGIKLQYIPNSIENSLTVARNLAVKHAKGDFISFLDDDVVLFPDYYEEIIKVFKLYPDALAVSGNAVIELGKNEKIAINILNVLSKIFNQSYYEKDAFRVLPSFAVTTVAPWCKDKIITNCQWSSGASTFRKEIFKEIGFDENLKKYAYNEDIDFGYSIFRRHPESLFFNLEAKYIHKISSSGRSLKKEIIYMEDVYCLYLFFKHIKQTYKNKINYIWGRMGKVIFKMLFLFYFGKKFNYRRIRIIDIINSIKANFYCIKHLKEIKNGDLDFFNRTIMK